MHPNEELLRRAYAAFAAGDDDTLRAVLAPTVVWHVAGHNPLAGTYRGPEEVLGYLGRLRALTDGTFRLEVHDVLANDEHALGMHRAFAERHGRRLADGEVLVCHVANGRVTEIWAMGGDQYLVDQFWSLG